MFFTPKLLSLEQASRISYESLGNCFVRDFIDFLGLDHINDFFIQDFLLFKMNFYGMHPPSTNIEIIPLDRLKYGDFKKERGYGFDFQKFVYNFYSSLQPNFLYTNIMVDSKKLKKYIKKRKSEYESIPKELVSLHLKFIPNFFGQD